MSKLTSQTRSFIAPPNNENSNKFQLSVLVALGCSAFLALTTLMPARKAAFTAPTLVVKLSNPVTKEYPSSQQNAASNQQIDVSSHQNDKSDKGSSALSDSNAFVVLTEMNALSSDAGKPSS